MKIKFPTVKKCFEIFKGILFVVLNKGLRVQKVRQQV